MVPLCILFAHHRNDSVTRHHLEILKNNNPNVPIVLLCNGAEEALEGAVDVAMLSPDFRDENKWLGSDAMLYLWFRHCRNVEAERYAIIEWDALATMPLHDYYTEVWDADAAASQVKTLQTTPQWDWFGLHGARLPERLKPHAAGLVPFNGILLSHRALEQICRMEIPRQINNELRLGTLLASSGILLTAFPFEKAAGNDWREDLITIRPTPGLYHPVKRILPDVGNRDIRIARPKPQ